MAPNRFLQALRSGRVLLMDGAMGTELQRAGLKPDECGEQWNLTHPDRVRDIHQAYIDAGADCLLTNTFQANEGKLGKHGLATDLQTIDSAAVGIAREVAGNNRFVFGDIGPLTGADSLDAAGDAALIPLVESLRYADALLLETWSHSLAVWVARRLKELSADMPVLLSLTYRRDDSATGGLRTQSWHTPEWFAMLAKPSGIAAIGVNCGRDIGMDEIIDIVRLYRQVTDVPIFARPNAGSPERIGERWVYPETPEKMAARLPELLEAGVSMVGGCCGTTPKHIAAFRPIIDDWNKKRDK